MKNPCRFDVSRGSTGRVREPAVHSEDHERCEWCGAGKERKEKKKSSHRPQVIEWTKRHLEEIQLYRTEQHDDDEDMASADTAGADGDAPFDPVTALALTVFEKLTDADKAQFEPQPAKDLVDLILV